MSKELLSENERTFILQGITTQSGIRLDGRGNEQVRRKDVQVNPVAQAMGSCRVTLQDTCHGTDVLVAIKGEIVQDASQSGIKVVLESSNFAELREERNSVMAQWFTRLFKESKCIDAECLVILEDRFFWSLTAEVLIISDLGGGLFDCVGLGLKEALNGCRLPHVQVEVGGESEALTVSDDPSLSRAVQATQFPGCCEVGVISGEANCFLIDMSMAEEECCQCTFWAALHPHTGKVFCIEQVGNDALLDPQVIPQVLSRALANLK